MTISWKLDWARRVSIMLRSASARDSLLAASRFVVGSSSARMPHFRQNVSARASLMIKHAKTCKAKGDPSKKFKLKPPYTFMKISGARLRNQSPSQSKSCFQIIVDPSRVLVCPDLQTSQLNLAKVLDTLKPGGPDPPRQTSGSSRLLAQRQFRHLCEHVKPFAQQSSVPSSQAPPLQLA